jgi:hypothetical protein
MKFISVGKPKLGSTRWGLKRNGLMNTTEILTFTAEAIVTQMKLQCQSLLGSSAIAEKRLARIDTSRIKLPDSTIVIQAKEPSPEITSNLSLLTLCTSKPNSPLVRVPPCFGL